MKQFFLLLICVCLLLSACGTKPTDTTPSTDTTPTEASTQPTTEETTVPETTEAPVYYNPLTGEATTSAQLKAPTAIVINNIQAALPQHGVSQADIIYEIETEGGITRCLAFFTDLSSVGEIGAVRSARTFFNNVAVSYGATLIHCGGSAASLKGCYSDDGNTIKNWAHINEISNGKYFYRNQSRISSGYSREHTLFTNGEKLLAGLTDLGYNKTLDAPVDYGYLFSDTVALDGDAANKVTVRFYGKKTTTMTYNPETGLYEGSQYKKDYIDGNTKEIMSFRNVLVLHTRQWKIHDGTYARSYYDLIGSGEGYFACNGKIVPIQWSRASLYEPFRYTLADGTPLTLGVGTSYIAVASTSGATTFE